MTRIIKTLTHIHKNTPKHLIYLSTFQSNTCQRRWHLQVRILIQKLEENKSIYLMIFWIETYQRRWHPRICIPIRELQFLLRRTFTRRRSFFLLLIWIGAVIVNQSQHILSLFQPEVHELGFLKPEEKKDSGLKKLSLHTLHKRKPKLVLSIRANWVKIAWEMGCIHGQYPCVLF